MIKNYFLVTWRSLLKKKVFVFINIVGVGAIIIFLSVLTAGLKTIRAAMMSPVKNLRTE